MYLYIVYYAVSFLQEFKCEMGMKINMIQKLIGFMNPEIKLLTDHL